MQSSRTIAAAIALGLTLVACSDNSTAGVASRYADGRLFARPSHRVDTAIVSGLSYEHPSGETRELAVYVPQGYAADRLWPVTVLLHGSTGSGHDMATDFEHDADANGVILLAPSSHDFTWDRMASGHYGPDVAEIDGALQWAFDHLNIDPHRVGIAGFSDGASYSILVGLKNGDLFTHVMAFAQCAGMPDEPVGLPAIFIGHGVDDHVLPIDECSRVLVPKLQLSGYDVEYEEYPTPDQDGHYVPEAISMKAFAWFVNGRG